MTQNTYDEMGSIGGLMNVWEAVDIPSNKPCSINVVLSLLPLVMKFKNNMGSCKSKVGSQMY